MNIKNFEVENARKREDKDKKVGKAISAFIALVSVMSILFSILVIVYGFYHLHGKFRQEIKNI